MKTDLMAQTTDDARASTDTTSEYSLISDESPDIENMEKLREKIKNQDIIIRDFETKLTDAEKTILNQNEKISLYEIIIRDKNDLIKSLNISIELMKENKELAIKQLKDQFADLQNAPDLSKNLPSKEEDGNAAESAEFEKKPTENSDFQMLQKLFAESQSQNETLKDIICQLKTTDLDLKLKLDENLKQMAILEEKSDTENHKLRAKIAELEKNAKIYEDRSKEDDGTLAKRGLNAKSGQSTDPPFVFPKYPNEPNIKIIKIGDQDSLGIVENGWTVILRRFDGSVNFSERTLTNSFGDLSGEFWFGLESIHKLTSSTRHELYIQLVDFDDETAYARYDNFVVGSEKEKYALKSLGAYSGNAGDALRSHEKATINYTYNGRAHLYWWWSAQKNQCCLTGKYIKTWEAHSEADMHWGGNWNLGKRYSLNACKMLIRPHGDNTPLL